MQTDPTPAHATGPYAAAHHPDRTDDAAIPSSASVQVSKERVAGLFDGIVAITATLLVIDVGVASVGGELTLSDLGDTSRRLLHWGVSFIMAAVIWTEFHVVFAHTKRWDGGLLAVTLAQMAAISLIPLGAQVVGDYPDSVLASALFAAIMGVNGLFVTLNLMILRHKSQLHLSDHSMDHLALRVRSQLVIYPIGIALSLGAAAIHDPVAGVLVWAACPLALVLHIRHLAASDAPSLREEETVSNDRQHAPLGPDCAHAPTTASERTL